MTTVILKADWLIPGHVIWITINIYNSTNMIDF